MFGGHVIGGFAILFHQVYDQRFFLKTTLVGIVFGSMIPLFPGGKVLLRYLGNSLPGASTCLSKAALPPPRERFFFKIC
jgi:hypothetical protein